MTNEKQPFRHNAPQSQTRGERQGNTILDQSHLNHIKSVINGGFASYEMVKTVEAVARSLANRSLTTSQVRKFYGEMMRIQMVGLEKERSSLLLLVPKLYYNMKRNDKDKYEGLRGLKELVETMVKEVDSSSNPSEQKEKFKRMLQITEAFVAFHKVYDAIYSNKKNKNQQ